MNSVLLALLLVLFTGLGYLAYVLGHKNRYFFKDRKINYLKPQFIFGNSLLIFRKNIYDFLGIINKDFKDDKMVGFFDFRTPVVLLRDPELIKQVVVKNFDHFTDHRVVFDETVDKLFGCSLFFMRGQKWRDMRATLSPAFTGRKMRLMLQLIVSVAEQSVDFLITDNDKKVTDDGAGGGDDGIVEYEMRDVCSRFANDIIALCAFGIDINSYKDRENDFFQAGQSLQKFTKLKGIVRMFAVRLFPWLTRALDIQMFDMKTRTFFKDLILNTIAYRRANNIYRPDLVNLLMEVRKGLAIEQDHDDEDNVGFATVQESNVGKEGGAQKRTWTDDELVAQCFVFFIAGFDSVSNLMQFCCYELAINGDIQERLCTEIKDMNESLEGKRITYESLQQMKYLDMVVTETLRRWSPVPITDRMCTKDLHYKDDKGYDYHFEEGTGIWFSSTDMQMNPLYYPDPERFDPERFNEENRNLVNPDTYFPFGLGPRNCIGSRFALMETKALLYHLLLKFSFHVTKQTQIPLLLKDAMGTTPRDGIWIGMKKR